MGGGAFDPTFSKDKKDKKDNKKSHKPEVSGLSSDMAHYLSKIEPHLEISSSIDGTEEEHSLLLVSNVYTEISGNELAIAAHFEGSRVFEKLIRLSNEFQLRVLIDRFSGNYEKVATDKFASHVLQSLVKASRKYIQTEVETATVESILKVENKGILLSFSQLIIRIANELQPNLKALIKDVYASHVVRSLIITLFGNSINTCLKEGNDKGDPSESWKVPEPLFSKSLAGLLESTLKGMKSSELVELCMHPNASPVLQMVLNVEKKTLTSSIIYENLFDTTHYKKQELKERMELFHSLCFHTVGSRFLQVLFSVMEDPKTFETLYDMFMKNTLCKFIKDKNANFVVQSFIQFCKDKKVFEDILHEINEILPHILKWNRFGVVAKIAEKALLLNLVSSCLHVHLDHHESKSPPNVVLLLIYLTAKEDYNEKQDHASQLLGCLCASTLLKYPNNQPIVESFLQMGSSSIFHMAKDIQASHVVDSFFDSLSVPKLQKEALVKKLMTYSIAGSESDRPSLLAELAMHKSGSFIFEKLYKESNMKLKEMLVEALVENPTTLNLLQGSRYGKLIGKKIRLDDYLKDKSEWKRETQRAESKTKPTKRKDELDKIFEAVIEEPFSHGNRKKKTKQKNHKAMKTKEKTASKNK